jgi:hypothetical protein
MVLEVRRSPTLLLLPVMALLGLFIAWRGTYAGVVLGNRATAATISMNQLLGPLAGGVAAYGARRARMDRLGPMLALGVRTRPAILLQLIGLMLPAAAAYLAVASVMAVRTMMGHPFGQLGWDGALAGLLGLCVHIAFGFAVGLMMPFRITPPLLVVMVYVLETFAMDGYGDFWYLYSPVLVETVTAFWTWQSGLFWPQSLWYAALIVTLAVAAIYVATRTGWRWLATAVVVTVLAAVPLWSFEGKAVAPGRASFEYICTADQPVICVHPAYEFGVPELRSVFGTLAARLAGTPARITRLQQIPRDGFGLPVGSQGFSMDDVTDHSAQAAAKEYGSNLVDGNSAQMTSPLGSSATSWSRGSPARRFLLKSSGLR